MIIIMMMMMMTTLHCPMWRTLFTNIPMSSAFQNDVEIILKTFQQQLTTILTISNTFVRAQLPETNNCNNDRATPGSFRCSSKCTTCPYCWFSVSHHSKQIKIKLRTVQQFKSRIWEMKGGKYTKTLAKIRVRESVP